MAGDGWLSLHMAGRWPPRMAPIFAAPEPMSARCGWGEDGIFFEDGCRGLPLAAERTVAARR